MFKKIIAAFFAVVFSATLVGCGTDMGNDLSSDISSIMDPDTNNSMQTPDTSNNQSNTVPDNSTTPSTNSTTAKISKEKAKEIALKHANVNESDVKDYEIELDNENGKLVYDISFDANGKEYDYDIDADTGTVTNSKNEIID